MSEDLINYIRTHLNSGYNKQEIKQHLLNNGWANEQIDKAFEQVNNYKNSQNKKRFNWLWIILPILIIVIGTIFWLYFTNYNKESNNIKNSLTKPNSQQIKEQTQEICVEEWVCSDWSSCASGSQTRTCTDTNSCGTANNKPDEQKNCDAQETVQQLTDCDNTGILIDFSQQSIEMENEDNYNCFANLIENCQKAKLVHEIDIRGLLGVNQKYSNYYELKGLQSGKCELCVKMNSYDSFSYTDSAVQNLLNSGMSQEEINQQEQEFFDRFQQLVGRDGVCKYSNPLHIKDHLDDFREGHISGSTEDRGLPNADECSGLIFEFVVETTS